MKDAGRKEHQVARAQPQPATNAVPADRFLHVVGTGGHIAAATLQAEHHLQRRKNDAIGADEESAKRRHEPTSMAIFAEKANVLVGGCLLIQKFETKFPQGFDVEKDHRESKGRNRNRSRQENWLRKRWELRETEEVIGGITVKKIEREGSARETDKPERAT